MAALGGRNGIWLDGAGMSYSRNPTLLLVTTFFSNLIFQRGIFILYLMEKGIGETHVGVLQSCVYLANFLWEIPAGVVGDRFGRKWSLAIGYALAIVNGLGMVFADDFGLFLCLFIIEGTSLAFISGSNSALLYDSLKKLRRTEDYLKLQSRISMISAVILGLAIGLGGFIRTWDWQYVYLSYAVAMACAAMTVLLLHERIVDFAPEDASEERRAASTVRETYLFFRCGAGREFFLCILALVCFNAGVIPYFIYGQSLFHHFGFADSQIALIYCTVQLISGAVYLSANRVAKLAPLRTIATTAMILAAIAMAANATGNVYVCLFSFYFVTIFPDVVEILCDNHIQSKIPSHFRATALSSITFAQGCLLGFIYFAVGFGFQHIGILATFAAMSLAPLVSFALYWSYFNNAKGGSDLVLETHQ